MRNLFKLLCLVITTSLLLGVVKNSYAQKTDTQVVVKQVITKPVTKKSYRSKRDSLLQKRLQRDALIRSFKHSDASVNDLLGKIEQYNSSYIETKSELDAGFDTVEISQRLPTIERRMTTMRNTIESSTTLGYLITIRNMIDRLKGQTDDWQTQLNSYSDAIDTIRQDVAGFKADTTFKTVPEDSALRVKTTLQIQELEKKWQRLDVVTQKDIIRIGLLENRVSSLSILLIDLDNQIDHRIHDFTMNALENEYGYIWDMHKKNSSAPLDTAIDKTYTTNSKFYKYFFTGKGNYYGHFGSILLLIAFFTWIYTSKRKLARVNPDHENVLNQTHYIVKHPYLTTLAITALLAPYLYDHPALIFVQTMLIVMMAAIGPIIKTAWPKPLFDFWIILMVLVVLFSICSVMILTTNAERILLLLLSAAAIYASYRLLKQLKLFPDDYPPYTTIALKIFMVVNTISVLMNIAGRFTLGKIAGTTVIYNLCLLMGFYLLVQVLMEALFLQLEANKKSDNTSIASYLDFKILQKKFKDVLINLSVLLWLVALTKNLTIDDYLYDNVYEFLNDSHKFNSTAFTFKSVLVFIFVIWVSGLLARIISYFYDFTAQQTKLTPQAKKTRSSILLIRLTVFVVGFFVAVNAAGIPMNQITLIIGALGVGIGFGLQNIINNLVSGVILAFEKPIQVGDVIEVSGKSGTIKEIGIRSSKIACGDGSELIVPNGDLISQHVVNWTLSDNNRRIELFIRIAYGTDIKKVEDILKNIINSHDDIMRSPAPSVFLHNFSESAIDFRIFFWAADLSTWLSLKSNVLTQIYAEFAKEGIEIPHGTAPIQVSFPEGNLPGAGKKSAKNNPEPPEQTA
jgi:small-conductance mechanosensitive channel